MYNFILPYLINICDEGLEQESLGQYNDLRLQRD